MRYLVLALLVLLVPFAAAEEYKTILLTVSEGNETDGGTAEAYLEIRPGNGRIFIDSFPISKTDTQFSTRFANEVACDFLRADCHEYDFFYTIRADSAIVGGPSAGAALAVLTVAALDEEPLRQDVAMTGTINSGGVIGPVAGIIAKAEAARDEGVRTVVVPSLSPLGLDLLMRNETANASDLNLSRDLDGEVLENLSADGFEVVQANDLYEALPYFIDKEYAPPSSEVRVPEEYTETMRRVSEMLCDRRDALRGVAGANESSLDPRVANASAAGRYYAVASFCFGDNIDLQERALSQLDDGSLRQRMESVSRELLTMERTLLGRNLSTISDVETYAIVRERIVDAEERLVAMNRSNISVSELAYVIERAFSARAWSEFFGMESAAYEVDEAHLRRACVNKLTEAEERVTYVESYLPSRLTAEGREELGLARRDLQNEEYALCLFKASKAKAEANILASVLAVTESRIDLLVDEKLRAVERVMARQSEQGLFPVMGYSYLEYARSLEESEPYSALTFAEYALELGNLHVYFPPEESWSLDVDWESVVLFVGGFVAGAIVVLFVYPGRIPARRRGDLPGKKR